MIRRATVVALAVLVTASSPRRASADIEVPGRSEVDVKFVEVLQNYLKELTIDLSLVPQAVEFEGFINYGSPIQSTLTNTLGQPITGFITPSVFSRPIFSTRKVLTSVSLFDGQPVVLGGLIREEVQKVEDKTADGGASNRQKLIKERDQLKQRLLEVEALLKNAKE